MKTSIPPKVMTALKQLYEGLDPHDIFSLAEVMRMMGQEEMMQESDPDALRVFTMFNYLILLLKAMAEQERDEFEKVKNSN